MKITRKQFLRIVGISALAASGGKLMRAFSGVAPGSARLQAPLPRWGLAIDFKKCRFGEGCDDCLATCKQVHNIPDLSERSHEVKWVWKERFENVFPFEQTDYTRQALAGHPLPVLCNHCGDPACVRVCPTQATWKRGDGVVMMDYHRCIGCRYCMAACPYGSRSFNWEDPRPHIAHVNPDFPTRTKGVVEKCNFCEERLAKGKLPACVEGCRQKAITFGDLNDANSPLRRILATQYAIQRKPELGTAPAVYYLI